MYPEFTKIKTLIYAGFVTDSCSEPENIISKLLADRLPPGVTVHIDLLVLPFTISLAVVTGNVFGILPGLLSSGKNVREELTQGGRLSAAAVSHRLRGVLVMAEIAFSLVLLAGAGLLLRSFVRLMNVDRGFDADHVLTLRIWPSPMRYADPHKYIAYVDAIVSRIQALPGVKAAGWASCLPVSGSCIDRRFRNPRTAVRSAKQDHGCEATN